MDFIERILRASPDGGSGTLEISLLVSALVVATLVSLSRRIPLFKR